MYIGMNPGSIVMENDHLEILVDAGTGKVFSEAWKWRPEVSMGPVGPAGSEGPTGP